MNILRSFDPKVYDAIQGYRAHESELPWEYREDGGGRTKHDDWAIMRGTTRLETAYRVPLPFRQDSGASEKRWILWDPSYPSSPGLQIEERVIYHSGQELLLPHALVDCAVEGEGSASFSAFINGAWTPCFRQYRKKVFGRLLAYYSGGLKQDITVGINDDFTIKSDIMGWWDPPSLSWNKVG